MRIVLIASSYLPVLGGLQEAVSQLVREFVAQGHEVLVVANRYPRSLLAAETIEGIPVQRLLFPGFFLGSWHPVRVLKYLGGLLLAMIGLLRLVALLQRFRPDVVNIHFLGSQAPYATLAARWFGIRCVVSLHGNDVEGVPHRSRLDHLLFVKVVGSADYITACSQYLLDEAKKIAPEIAGKSTAISNGIRMEEFAQAEPHNHPRPYIFAAGRFVDSKGFDILLRAYRQVLDAGHSADLILAGDGPERECLLALALELSLQIITRASTPKQSFNLQPTEGGRVIFWGNAIRAEMKSLMRGCEIFVIPSRQESFGIVALEALAAARPIVANRVGGLEEILKDIPNVTLSEAGDPSSLALGLRKALDSVLAPPIVDLSRFTWEKTAANFITVLKGSRPTKPDCIPS